MWVVVVFVSLTAANATIGIPYEPIAQVVLLAHFAGHTTAAVIVTIVTICPLMVCGLLVVLIPTYMVFDRYVLPKSARAIAAFGHCAACDYEIMDIKPEPDCCTVCPECGAAWIVHGPAEPPRGTIAP